MKSEENKTSIECRLCHKQFKYESEKKRHEESHTPQFQCNLCLKKFSFLSALRRHEKQHDRVEDVLCSECNRKFRDETLLKRHMNYAHKGTFVCSKCSTKFNSEPALRTHMKTHRPVSERKFHCNFEGCNKSFNFQHHLKHHEMTHTNTKQYFCNMCGKGFIQLHHLKTHIKTHSLERLQCSVARCNKTFTNEYARKRHLATHSGTSDSGLSSDSNSGWETSDMKMEESSKCLPAIEVNNEELNIGQIINYSKDINDSINSPITDLPENPEIATPQDLSLKPFKNYNYDEIEDFRTCKAVLGGCIVSADGEVNENCLCAQMTCNNNDLNSKTIKLASKFDNNLNEIPKTVHVDKENACEGCACNPNGHIKGASFQCSSGLTSSEFSREIPELEYRNDGTIKIKETFDTDIGTIVEINNDVKKDLWPFNSCKSVLGKCIATESGQISDGCLCAKMAFADSINAEEIDEITPQPMCF